MNDVSAATQRVSPATQSEDTPLRCVIAVDGVDVVRGGRHLLSDVSLRVHEGEHWAIIGPNGAGKSTLVSLLGALTHPTRGDVHVLGHRLGRVDMRELRAFIGHVDPRHRLDRPLPAIEVVLTGLTNTALLPPRTVVTTADRDRARSLLSTMGLGESPGIEWTTMSQGERGRTLIARALMGSPRLLLLDEPATGLDLAAREQLLSALTDLRAEVPSLSTVMVTHYLEDLPTMTSHAMLVADGRVVHSGPVQTSLTSEHVSTCFGYPVSVTSTEGRWNVRARTR